MPIRSGSHSSAAARVAGFLAATLVLLASGRPLHAADATSPLAGRWVLEAADNIDGHGIRSPAFGPHPQGCLIVDAGGHYSLQIFRGNNPTKVDGRNVYKDAQLVSSHFGQIRLDARGHTLSFVIDMAYSPHWNPSGAYSPNWNGSEQVRAYTLDADELSYQVPPEPGSGITPVSVWRRVSPR